MLDRINCNLSRLKNDIRSTMELISHDFDKLEKKVGNYEASKLMNGLEDCKDDCSQIYGRYREIMKDLDTLNDEIKEIEDRHKDIRNDIVEVGF